MKLDRLHWSLIAVIVVLVIWLASWDYHHINDQLLIRVNRVTGTTERFYGQNGWREVGSNR
jgi:hypothetical protein